jgi:hypothetical protein
MQDIEKFAWGEEIITMMRKVGEICIQICLYVHLSLNIWWMRIRL